MNKPITWTPKQLALAVYAHLYGIEDLGMPLPEILRLAGLSMEQWQTRITIDFAAQEGTSNFTPRIANWYDEYMQFRKMPRADLLQYCGRFLQNMRVRKG